MSKTRNLREILLGIICSLLIWALAIVLSGEILGGDVLSLSYSSWGLGKIYLPLFFAYNICIAIYSKRKSKKLLFISSYIIILLPIICYYLSFLAFAISTASYILYPLGIPAATAIYIYDESAEMTIISGIVILLSPILSIVIYKYTKPINLSSH